MRSSRVKLKIAAVAALSCSLFAGPGAGSAAAATCANADAYPGEATRVELARATVCRINKERRVHGLRKLRLNPRLSAAARAHSRDMVARRYFDHVSKEGRDVVDRLTRTGYLGEAPSWVVGENLAWGAGSRSTPRQIVSAWMHSPGHRQNILTNRFRELGIGIVFDTPTNVSATGATYTTTFGSRG